MANLVYSDRKQCNGHMEPGLDTGFDYKEHLKLFMVEENVIYLDHIRGNMGLHTYLNVPY